jgi:two-component system CheB/CheR fusion protein
MGDIEEWMSEKKPKRPALPAKKIVKRRPEPRKSESSKAESSKAKPPKSKRKASIQVRSAPRPAASSSGAKVAPTAVPASAHGDEGSTSAEARFFPVIGIGASAGGLEALEKFLRNVAADSGAAYVVIQHLDPTPSGALPKLLQRDSPIPVLQAHDGLKIAPNHCYVIAPNYDMSLMHGTLYLLPQATPRRLNLPIDFFFRSLAADQHERSIGVILSGMGHDGTLGLHAIKERGGAAFAQSLSSAKFDSMPRSAMETGLVDVIAPAEELPRQIHAYLQHTSYFGRRNAEQKSPSTLEKVFVLLRTHTGNDFFLYKRSTIQRRIERRMGLHQIDGIEQYVKYLRENSREIDLLFKELLIGVTNFFRDPPAWEALQKEVFPRLIAGHSGNGPLRAWVTGCSTGEEAYSLAMCFREAAEPFKAMKSVTLQIFATDLDRDAIEKARHGLYLDAIAADVSPERLRRFFVQEERGFRVSKEIREMVVFAPQNLIMDPPFTKLDILTCRNLLIYLSAELQKKLIPLFHYTLNREGVLFLGSAETVGAFSNLFHPLDTKNRIYRRLEQPALIAPFEFPSSIPAALGNRHEGSESDHVPFPPPSLNLERLADRVLVQRFAPLGVLCNDKGDILYLSGRAGKYLEPAVGKANLNIFAMARDGLRYELSSAFATASRENRLVAARGVSVGTNGGRQTVDVTVQRLTEPKELRGTLMVVITDVTAPKDKGKPGSAVRKLSEPIRVAELEQDLQRAREEVQTTREEMQTSQEELKSTNEELQSANEELQSTNEELTTSKEEMQSLNEELQTVNHELQSKVDELSRSNNDMKNLLNSTDIATLFLDGNLHVRRFTTPTAKIIKLIPGDAGRPITDIASDLNYPDLSDDAREVLRTLVFKEQQCSTRDGRWFFVRILPYRTLENVIDGVVITFTDASAARALETSLREQASELRQMAESLPVMVWGSRVDGTCDYVNTRWLEYTGATESELTGYGWLSQVHPEDRESVREAWRASVRTGTEFNSDFRIRSVSGVYRMFRTRAVALRDSQRHIIFKWYGTNTDLDDTRSAKPRQVDQSLTRLLEDLAYGLIVLDGELTVTTFNGTAAHLCQRDASTIVGKQFLEVFPEARDSALAKTLTDSSRQSVAATLDAELAATKHTFRIYPNTPQGCISILFAPQEISPSPFNTMQEGS